MLQNKIRHTKSLRKNGIFKKNLMKNVRKIYEKTYDSLLAHLGKHQTCMQKFVQKNLRNRNLLTPGEDVKILRRFYESS